MGLIQGSTKKRTVFSRERQTILDALKEATGSRPKLTSFAPAPRGDGRHYYRRDYGKEWSGYVFSLPVGDVKRCMKDLNELRKYFSCRGKKHSIMKKTGTKLAVSGRLYLDFDLFTAEAEYFIIPDEQEPLKWKDPPVKKTATLAELKERDDLTLEDLAKEMKKYAKPKRRRGRKGDEEAGRRKLVKPTMTRFIKDGASGVLSIKLPTQDSTQGYRSFRGGRKNLFTLHFVAVVLGYISIGEDYDPLLELSRSIRRTMVRNEEAVTTFADVGGYAELKKELETAYVSRHEQQKLFDKLNLSNRHYLFAGPAGTGKSMMLKAMMVEFGDRVNILPFHQVFRHGIPLEAIFNFIATLEEKTGRPTLLLYDEIDDIGHVRDEEGHSIPVTDLLRTLDGVLEHNVSMVATTNRPHVLDPALLRPGRLSPIIVFGPPGEESRREIFQIYLDKVKKVKVTVSEEQLDKLVEKTKGFTGADIKELIDSVLFKQLENGGESDLKITSKMLLDLIKEVREQKVKKNEAWNARVEKVLAGEGQVSMIYQ